MKKKLFQFIEKTFPIDFLFLFVFRKVKKKGLKWEMRKREFFSCLNKSFPNDFIILIHHFFGRFDIRF